LKVDQSGKNLLGTPNSSEAQKLPKLDKKWYKNPNPYLSTTREKETGNSPDCETIVDCGILA